MAGGRYLGDRTVTYAEVSGLELVTNLLHRRPDIFAGSVLVFGVANVLQGRPDVIGHFLSALS